MVVLRSVDVSGRYSLHDKIASGGMASVHFGRLLGSAGFSRTVAIKRLHAHLADDPHFLSTMIDEARLAARIHHPNVVPTLDVVKSDGTLFIVMEYVRGESLAQLLRAELSQARAVPLPIASAIVVGALHGLHAAHEATDDRGEALDIVHRDISPQNILVGVDGVSRVIDFGIAKASGRLQTTSEGSVKGKIAYMASEQLMAQQVTRRADVFAMGVVLWEMLAGRRLFQAESEAVLVAVVLAGARVAPSHHSPAIPPDLDALVMKALASDPGQRFESARAMAEALCAIVPPAFPAEVGAWVQQAAAESLAGREAVLAEIESGSGAVVVAGAALSDAALADDPTREEIANLVVETPANERPAAQSRRTRLVALGSVALVATAALGIELAWPSKLRATPTTIVASTVAASEPLSVGSETSPPRDSAGAAEATPVDLPPPTATATATATASARLSPHPAGHAGHARATPSAAASAAPLHFTRPD